MVRSGTRLGSGAPTLNCRTRRAWNWPVTENNQFFQRFHTKPRHYWVWRSWQEEKHVRTYKDFNQWPSEPEPVYWHRKVARSEPQTKPSRFPPPHGGDTKSPTQSEENEAKKTPQNLRTTADGLLGFGHLGQSVSKTCFLSSEQPREPLPGQRA